MIWEFEADTQGYIQYSQRRREAKTLDTFGFRCHTQFTGYWLSGFAALYYPILHTARLFPSFRIFFIAHYS